MALGRIVEPVSEAPPSRRAVAIRISRLLRARRGFVPLQEVARQLKLPPSEVQAAASQRVAWIEGKGNVSIAAIDAGGIGDGSCPVCRGRSQVVQNGIRRCENATCRVLTYVG